MEPMTSLLTIADILADPKYDSGELWDGCFVVKEASGGSAAYVGASISFALQSSSPAMSFGRVLDASGGYVLARDPDRMLSPDVSLMSFERCPTLPAYGFIEGAPELAVEVRSPRDSWVSVVEKGGVWIGHGARLVWCVDPHAETILVLRPGKEPELVGLGGVLDLAPLVEAKIPHAAIFRDNPAGENLAGENLAGENLAGENRAGENRAGNA